MIKKNKLASVFLMSLMCSCVNVKNALAADSAAAPVPVDFYLSGENRQFFENLINSINAEYSGDQAPTDEQKAKLKTQLEKPFAENFIAKGAVAQFTSDATKTLEYTSEVAKDHLDVYCQMVIKALYKNDYNPSTLFGITKLATLMVNGLGYNITLPTSVDTGKSMFNLSLLNILKGDVSISTDPTAQEITFQKKVASDLGAKMLKTADIDAGRANKAIMELTEDQIKGGGFITVNGVKYKITGRVVEAEKAATVMHDIGLPITPDLESQSLDAFEAELSSTKDQVQMNAALAQAGAKEYWECINPAAEVNLAEDQNALAVLSVSTSLQYYYPSPFNDLVLNAILEKHLERALAKEGILLDFNDRELTGSSYSADIKALSLAVANVSGVAQTSYNVFWANTQEDIANQLVVLSQKAKEAAARNLLAIQAAEAEAEGEKTQFDGQELQIQQLNELIVMINNKIKSTGTEIQDLEGRIAALNPSDEEARKELETLLQNAQTALAETTQQKNEENAKRTEMLASMQQVLDNVQGIIPTAHTALEDAHNEAAKIASGVENAQTIWDRLSDLYNAYVALGTLSDKWAAEQALIDAATGHANDCHSQLQEDQNTINSQSIVPAQEAVDAIEKIAGDMAEVLAQEPPQE